MASTQTAVSGLKSSAIEPLTPAREMSAKAKRKLTKTPVANNTRAFEWRLSLSLINLGSR